MCTYKIMFLFLKKIFKYFIIKIMFSSGVGARNVGMSVWKENKAALASLRGDRYDSWTVR